MDKNVNNCPLGGLLSALSDLYCFVQWVFFGGGGGRWFLTLFSLICVTRILRFIYLCLIILERVK